MRNFCQTKISRGENSLNFRCPGPSFFHHDACVPNLDLRETEKGVRKDVRVCPRASLPQASLQQALSNGEAAMKKFHPVVGSRSALLNPEDQATADALQVLLHETLQKSSRRIVELFRAWDDDSSGKIDEDEFWRGVRALGFDVSREACSAYFQLLDSDLSGSIEYSEIAELMNASKGRVQTRRNLEKMAKHQADHSRMAKPTAKAMNRSYISARVSVVPEFVKLEPRYDISVQEQLHGLLKQHSVKLIDLFRQWDHDGNGGISFDEFREGFAALGYLAPTGELKAVFKSIDADHDNFVEFEEFKVALSLKGAQEATRLRGLEHADLSGSRPSAQLLGSFLAHHKKRLVQMFHEWDTDRNGALDKSELRKAIVALGWPASAASCNADLDEVYSRLDHDGDGTVTFAELQRGLNALGSNPGRPGAVSASGASKTSPAAEKQKKLRWENGVLVEKGSSRPTVSTAAVLEKGTKPPGASAFGAGMAGMAKDATPAVQEAETEPRRPPPLPPPAPPAPPALAQVCAAWLEEERLVEARRAFLMQKLSAEGYGVQSSLRRSQSPPPKAPSSAPVERSASFGRIRYPTARAVAGEPLVHRSTSFGRAPARFRGGSRHRGPAVL